MLVWIKQKIQEMPLSTNGMKVDFGENMAYV